MMMDDEMICKKQNRVFKDLVKGKEYANQLQALLLNNTHIGDEGLVLAEKLAQKVLKTFTKSLSQVSQIQSASASASASASGSVSSGDLSFQHSKRSDEVKDRRGVYKRRRTTDSWVINSTTIGDGYAWRKYGQKEIQNSNHPRCYFRCTHKYDQGCPAIKQVQKINQENNIVLYQTTYFGNHTCKNTRKGSQIISDSDESNLLSFQVKQECKEETQSDVTDHDNKGNSSEPTMMEISQAIGSFNGEVVSSHGDDQLDIFSKFIDFNTHDDFSHFYDNNDF